ncbi:MAG: hypothetical protein MUE85_21230 [Microscillaceae bacterium]|jgi:DNA repair exonuclease SbcCD ATPase subunit|nr:hypothetical protein [Microscillaceae bacterium]
MQNIYPFKFLDAYTQADKDIFFGREAEIQALYEMAFQADLILVYGFSGTGKSSLIQCGLANKFQSHDWLPIFIRRGANLNHSLEKAIIEAGGGNAEAEDLDWFESGEISPLAQKFRAVYLQHFRPIYLIFDQFEELYILGTKDEQTQFIQTIQEILKIEQPIKIIFSVREEYLGELYEFEKEVPELLRKKLRIEPMHLDKVRQVLTGINQLKNSLVHYPVADEEPIAEEIFAKIKGDEKTLGIQLPYLQVFLDKWYLMATQDESRQTAIQLNLESLNLIGDIGDVMGDFLNTQVFQVAQMFEQKPETIWEVLSPFVTLEGTKEPLNELKLAQKLANLPSNLLKNIVNALNKRRILRFEEDEQVYEIAHDSLAKQIAEKRTDEQIAILEVQRLVKAQAYSKKDVREYFTEKQLNFIEPYLSRFKASEEELNWIEQSRQHIQTQKDAEQQRQAQLLAEAEERAQKEAELRKNAEVEKQNALKSQKRAKLYSVIAIMVAFVSVVGAGFAIYFYMEANKARAYAIESVQRMKKAQYQEQQAQLQRRRLQEQVKSKDEQSKIMIDSLKKLEDKIKEAEIAKSALQRQQAHEEVIKHESSKISGFKKLQEEIKAKIKKIGKSKD